MIRWTARFLEPGTMPLTALLAAAMLVLAGGYLAYYEDALNRAQQTEDIRVQGDILASGVVAALIFNDFRAAQEYANAMQANPTLEAVGVYSANSKPVAGFVRPGEDPLPARVKTGPPRVSSGRLVIVLPVVQKGISAGFVYLRAAVEPLQRRIMRYAGILLLVTMAALVLVVFATAQFALSGANKELEARAIALSKANSRLQTEMEERSKAEDALRQSQKMEAIGQLSGGIAHDFNNLLTIIKGNLQLLQRRLQQGQTDVSRYINAAMEGSDRAANLTQRILAFSRRQPLSPQPVNLTALVKGMIDLVRHSLGERATLYLDLRSTGWVVCDANQMENVLLNLVINARDAMPQGGRLTISTVDESLEACEFAGEETSSAGDYVRLSVSDTGMGMSDEVRAKALDPFFTTKPVGQGTGLGLSMTFGYVRQSGGQMRIASEVGKGTTVTILMPRHRFESGGEA